jgi:hypothetical protein
VTFNLEGEEQKLVEEQILKFKRENLPLLVSSSFLQSENGQSPLTTG